MKKQSFHHGNTLKTPSSSKIAPGKKALRGKKTPSSRNTAPGTKIVPSRTAAADENTPRSKRRYPEMPMIGVGGVVIRGDRALLIRRGSEPLKGEWSIPGGMLEVGETIAEGVARELFEETGLRVSVLDLIEVFERIFHESDSASNNATVSKNDRAVSANTPRSSSDRRVSTLAPELSADRASSSVAPKSNAALAVSAIAASAPPQEMSRSGQDSLSGQVSASGRPLYHFVILDYLCTAPEGVPRAGGDVTDVAFAAENELEEFHLTPTATRVIRRAFEMSRQRSD